MPTHTQIGINLPLVYNVSLSWQAIYTTIGIGNGEPRAPTTCIPLQKPYISYLLLACFEMLMTEFLISLQKAQVILSDWRSKIHMFHHTHSSFNKTSCCEYNTVWKIFDNNDKADKLLLVPESRSGAPCPSS